MRDYLEQVTRGLDANLYYLSLAAALTIPDMCAGLESPDGLTNASKYKAWYEEHCADVCAFLTGEDCYYYRCSMLHRGTSQHPKSSFSRVLFVEPGVTTNVFHCNLMNDALNIDVNVFCRAIVQAADSWLDRVEGTDPYESNAAKFMRRYVSGLRPYIVGVPVIS